MSDDAPAGSIQAYINANIKQKQEQEIQKIPVPRFEGRLVVRYKAIDPRSLIRLGLEAEKDTDEVNGVIMASVDALLAACDGTETDRGEDLGMPLGAALSTFLGFDGAHTDREGVFLIFDDEIALVNTANKLKQFQELANQRIGEDIVGNSDAAAL